MAAATGAGPAAVVCYGFVGFDGLIKDRIKFGLV
jgi:hypothetical protein